MSMKFAIIGGNMEITDNNQTIVSSNIAQEIKNNYQQSDDKKDCCQPELVVKD